jgi:hypothetical protein
VRRRAEEERHRESSARIRTLAIAAGLLVVVGFGGYFVVHALSQPRERAPRLEAFRVALAAGDAVGARALCSADYPETSWRKFIAILEREEWFPGGTTVGAPEVVRSGSRAAEVTFSLPRGRMRSMWRLEGRDWCLDQMKLEGVRDK